MEHRLVFDEKTGAVSLLNSHGVTRFGWPNCSDAYDEVGYWLFKCEEAEDGEPDTMLQFMKHNHEPKFENGRVEVLDNNQICRIAWADISSAKSQLKKWHDSIRDWMYSQRIKEFVVA